MPDTGGGAFVGYPHLLRQAKKARASKPTGPGPTVIDDFIGGLFGESSFEQPVSVLDPKAKTRNRARDAGYLIQQGSMIAPLARPAVALGKAVLEAPPVLGGSRFAQRGAVRVGGEEEAVASHSTTSPALGQLAEDPYLYAPSIGLHRASANNYAPDNPTFVWRAGALDRSFPNEAPHGIFNRDAYVWNPRQWSEGSIPEQWAASAAERSEWEKRILQGKDDPRLTQLAPDKGSQTAAILASPKFRSLEEWENSPFGFGALLQSRRPGVKSNALIDEYASDWNAMMIELGYDPSELRQRLMVLERLADYARTGDKVAAGGPILDLFDLARNAPSAMGELKLYAPRVPVTPGEAVLYHGKVPGRPLQELAERGNWALYDDRHLAGLAGNKDIADWRTSEYEKPLHLLAPASGKLPPPPEEALRMYNDLLPKGYVPGATKNLDEMTDAPIFDFDTLDAEAVLFKKVTASMDHLDDGDSMMLDEIASAADDYFQMLVGKGVPEEEAKSTLVMVMKAGGMPEEFATTFADDFAPKVGGGLKIPDDWTKANSIFDLPKVNVSLEDLAQEKLAKASLPAIDHTQQKLNQLDAVTKPDWVFKYNPQNQLHEQLAESFGFTKDQAEEVVQIWLTDLDMSLDGAIKHYIKTKIFNTGPFAQ